MPPRGHFRREVAEIFGAPLPEGGYLRVTASRPIQMLGLLGDNTKGTVQPVVLAAINAEPESDGH